MIPLENPTQERLLAGRRLEMALALEDEGDLDAAWCCLEEAFACDPDWDQAWFVRGRLAETRGDGEAAARAYRRYLDLDPADVMGATARLALIGAAATPARLPSAYVERLFDDYAPRFDEALVGHLDYRAPQVIAGLLDRLCPAGRWTSALDLGCGTGLAGVALGRRAARIDGIDLSRGMLRQAEATGLYTQLVRGDLADDAAIPAGPYDLVLAADSLNYLGDLAALFAAVRRRLAPGGLFVFTLERSDLPGYRLGEGQRFRHHEATVRAWAGAAMLAVAAIEPGVIRTERGRPVEALAVALTPLVLETQAPGMIATGRKAGLEILMGDDRADRQRQLGMAG
ncbi:MAG: methyltransferase domain-containing protein [Azospirillaceae bacterium]